MRKMQISQPDGFWLVTIAAVLWGTIGVATQAIYNLDDTSSLFINLSRMAIAAPALLFLCWRVVGSRMFQIRRRDLFLMLLSGVLLATSQSAYFAAIRYVGVTIATLLAVCLGPLVVTFFSVLLKFETLTGRVVAALILALVGSALLVGVKPPEGTSYDLPLGTILCVVSAVSYAGTILSGRFLAAAYHPLQVTAVGFTGGAVALALVNVLSGAVIAHTAQGWLLLLYLGLVPTALAYLMLQMGLRSVRATVASIMMMLEPTVAALLAWLLFGETLEAIGFIGAGLLILSIFLLLMDKRG